MLDLRPCIGPGDDDPAAGEVLGSYGDDVAAGSHLPAIRPRCVVTQVHAACIGTQAIPPPRGDSRIVGYQVNRAGLLQAELGHQPEDLIGEDAKLAYSREIEPYDSVRVGGVYA